jgi:hypothetical protein
VTQSILRLGMVADAQCTHLILTLLTAGSAWILASRSRQFNATWNNFESSTYSVLSSLPPILMPRGRTQLLPIRCHVEHCRVCMYVHTVLLLCIYSRGPISRPYKFPRPVSRQADSISMQQPTLSTHLPRIVDEDR